MLSISPNLSSWSLITFKSRQYCGFTSFTKCTAYASSSSRTAISASSLPEIETLSISADTTPLVKFEPVGFVKTLYPMFSNRDATIRAVVVFPFVPDTRIVPHGNCSSILLKNCGSIFCTTFPGKAVPPPRRRAAARTALPAAGVRIEKTDFRRLFAIFHTSCPS